MADTTAGAPFTGAGTPHGPTAFEGQRLGRYRLLEKLGQGGMATVFRAEDDELKRTVAIKLMHPFLTEKREGAARFVREARAVAALRHPNVLQVYDFVAEEGDRPAYLVMELIRGPSLRKFLDEHGAPLPEVAAMIGVKLAHALGAAHAAGIVHRDLKPENVMLDQGGRIVLCDFGIARLVAADSTMTATGNIVGSPAYMSPEQAQGEDIDHRSDLFSLGTVLYLLATGSPPFTAPQPLVLLNKITKGDHLPPSAKNARVPLYLERVIEKCLRVPRADRFADAAKVAEALDAGLHGDGLGDIERELVSYFADPPAYNEGAEPRIVQVSLAAATTAARKGELVQAMAHCNRVLAWRPDEQAAQTIMRRIGRRDRARRWMVIGGVVALAGLAAIPTVRLVRHLRDKPIEVAAVAPPKPLAPTAIAPGASLVVTPPPATPPPMSAVVTQPAGVAHTQRPAPPKHTTVATKVPQLTPSPTPPVVAPPPIVVAAPPPLPVVVAPTKGKLHLVSKPYCFRGVLDKTKPIDTGDTIELAPGEHTVHCEYTGGITSDKSVTVEPGLTAEVNFDFRSLTHVTLKLVHSDTVSLDSRPPTSAPMEIRPGMLKTVRFYRAGKEVRSAIIDIPPGSCVLGDDPPDCRKP